MAAGELKPHLRVERFLNEAPFRRPAGGGGGRRDYGRTYEQHAEALKREVATAWAAADGLLAQREAFEGQPGAYLEFSTAPEAPLPNLEWKREDMRLAAARRDEERRVIGAIFVPDEARDFLGAKLDQYGTQRTAKGQPVNRDRFEPIDRFSAARLETLWVDSRPIPGGADKVWWECWCWPDRVENLRRKAVALNLSISDESLKFPERIVLFIYADRTSISRLVSSSDAAAELRLGRDTAAFFIGEDRQDQDEWVQTLAGQLEDRRTATSPAVCLLDTGLNRAHPLLELVASQDDLHALKGEWGVDDSVGHGTELAGLAIYGDLVAPLQSGASVPIEVALESVKLLPPMGFSETEPGNYGLVTQQAVAIPEVVKPDRRRVFCLALSQDGVSGPRASSWSAAIDQAAAGAETDEDELRQRRLIVIAAGNIPDGLKKGDLEDWDSFEVEDPGQSWNALTVGGVTEKATITEEGYEHWSCAVGVDELSPYSRVSAAWNRSVSPVKPEVIVEAGNRHVDPANDDLVSGMECLSLLTTGHDVTTAPFSITWATSAAAAQVAGMAARVQAQDEDYWPETVRALIVHSAAWTPPMRASLQAAPQKGERLRLARRFGYGRPKLERARNSNSSSLALVSQAAIQPFVREGSKNLTNHFHLYRLPWPTTALAEMADHDVRLRVTLSYFIDPNPSADAPLAPARYRSFGLRFDLNKPGESDAAFARRMSALADDPGEVIGVQDDDPWRLFGAKAVSAGSLHSDEWVCSAADLIDRSTVAVFPVGGWWKQSRDPEVVNRATRYSLVVTLDAGDAEQDLYAEIETKIAATVAAAAEVEV